MLYTQERPQNTNHSEKRRKDDQSDHPESYDNEDRALAVENSSKCYGASYSQISVNAHRGDSKNRGSYRNTYEISKTDINVSGLEMLEHRLIRDSWANFKQHFP